MAIDPVDRERADLLETLTKHRGFLRQTIEGLDDEQVRTRSTASELCVGGIVKHVTAVERTWRDFMRIGPDAFNSSPEEYMAQWRVDDGQTAASLLADYDANAALTDELLASANLDEEHALPPATW